MRPFRIPDASIGAFDAATAARVVAASCDISLALDEAGIVQDIAIQPSHLALELDSFGRWIGRAWSDTVSADGRPKVAAMLEEADATPASSWRQLTHPIGGGREVAILYSVVKLEDGGRKLALGRDMRNVTAMQQRLIDAQMSMERDYAKLRFAETRYRLLFQTTHEAMLVVDGQTAKIVEANPAATALLDGAGMKRLVGRQFGDLFAPPSRARVQDLVADVRSARREIEAGADLAQGRPVQVSATSFRAEGALLILVRFGANDLTVASRDAGGSSPLAELVAALPDALVVADATGLILAANPAFAAMIELRDSRDMAGTSLEQWLGRPGVDFDLMMANLRQHKVLRLFPSVLRTEGGEEIDVELSAASLGDGKGGTFGFAVRDVGRRFKRSERGENEVTRSAEQLTELIGRVPLKEIVRETTDVIEKLCIEAALELTGDNRASASEVLGLSRQSLYVKLRRFGLADGGLEETL